METELVETTSEIFDEVKNSQIDVTTLEIKDFIRERFYDITYYIADGNIIGSWEHFSGVVRLEKSLVPEREEGWYRVRLNEESHYELKDNVMFYKKKGYFDNGHDCFDVQEFEWIDDNPIKFPED